MKSLGIVLVLALSAVLAEAQQPAARVETEAQGAGAPTAATVSAEQLVSEALERNPGVQAARHRVLALRHRIPQVKSLPDPKVSVGWMGNAAPFSVQDGDPSSYRSVGVMQDLPFPGKLGLRGDIAGKEAQAAWWEYEAARRQVTADVKTAYFDYFFYAKAIAITEKNRDLLSKLAQIAEARYRVGKGIQQDVLKAQTELSLILERLTVLEQQRDTAQARLNTLLSRAPDTPLAPAAEVQPAVLGYSLDELYELARKNDPGLQGAKQAIERNQYAVSLAHKDAYPDFGVGYMYQQRPLMPDMHGVTVSVNIPIFYKSKQREAIKEATEETLSAQAARDNRLNQVNFEVKQEYLMAQASQKLYDLYAKGVVPQASLALESSMSSYEVGNADFLTVLANFSIVLQYQIEYYRELANYESALARLEPLTGVELTTAQAQSPVPAEGPKQ